MPRVAPRSRSNIPAYGIHATPGRTAIFNPLSTGEIYAVIGWMVSAWGRGAATRAGMLLAWPALRPICPNVPIQTLCPTYTLLHCSATSSPPSSSPVKSPLALAWAGLRWAGFHRLWWRTWWSSMAPVREAMPPQCARPDTPPATRSMLHRVRLTSRTPTTTSTRWGQGLAVCGVWPCGCSLVWHAALPASQQQPALRCN